MVDEGWGKAERGVVEGGRARGGTDALVAFWAAFGCEVL